MCLPPKCANGSNKGKHPWACARACGGIHSRTGPLPVTLNPFARNFLGCRSRPGKAGSRCHSAESFRHGRVRGIFPDLFRAKPAAIARDRRRHRGTPRSGGHPRGPSRRKSGRNGSCSITATSSRTFSARRRANITISSGCGETPSALIFPPPDAPPEKPRRNDTANSGAAHPIA